MGVYGGPKSPQPGRSNPPKSGRDIGSQNQKGSGGVSKGGTKVVK